MRRNAELLLVAIFWEACTTLTPTIADGTPDHLTRDNASGSHPEKGFTVSSKWRHLWAVLLNSGYHCLIGFGKMIGTFLRCGFIDKLFLSIREQRWRRGCCGATYEKQLQTFRNMLPNRCERDCVTLCSIAQPKQTTLILCLTTSIPLQNIFRYIYCHGSLCLQESCEFCGFTGWRGVVVTEYWQCSVSFWLFLISAMHELFI